MPRVFVSPALKSLIPASSVDVEARTVRGVIEQLESLYPGVRDRLCTDEALKSGLAVSVDGQVASLGLYQKVGPDSEIHFVLAIGGG